MAVQFVPMTGLSFSGVVQVVRTQQKQWEEGGRVTFSWNVMAMGLPEIAVAVAKDQVDAVKSGEFIEVAGILGVGGRSGKELKLQLRGWSPIKLNGASGAK